MGLAVSIMRDADGVQCTNGFSKVFDRVLVVNVNGPADRHDMPRAYLVPGNLPDTCKLIPESDALSDSPRWLMFGGNFAYSSDSRWHEAVENLCGSRQSGAVPIHDRFEG